MLQNINIPDTWSKTDTNPVQNEWIYDEKHEPWDPDEKERVVAVKFEQVSRQQPQSLKKEKMLNKIK